MNIIKIMGGLGNQLFQYAFGKAQELNGIDVRYDASFYGINRNSANMRHKRWPRYYRLEMFNVSLFYAVAGNTQPTIKEANKPLDLSNLKKHPFNFDGYWQYPAYTDHILPRLREEFTLLPKYFPEACKRLQEQMQNTNSISVHVRRGDYVFQKGFYNLPFAYYMSAIREIPDGELFIFSDDLLWCKEMFTSDYFSRKITFVEGFEDYQDFQLMRSCKHHVMANSTLSYMVCRLEDRADSIIVAPSGWTSGARESKKADIMKKVDKIYYRKHWIKL